jgi:hypothetical protein
LVLDILVCELVHELDNVDHDVHVLVTEQPDEDLSRPCAYELGVCSRRRLRQREE